MEEESEIAKNGTNLRGVKTFGIVFQIKTFRTKEHVKCLLCPLMEKP